MEPAVKHGHSMEVAAPEILEAALVGEQPAARPDKLYEAILGIVEPLGRRRVVCRSMAWMRGTRPSRAHAACRWLCPIRATSRRPARKPPVHGSFEVTAGEAKIAEQTGGTL
jgi:hypothetical protein